MSNATDERTSETSVSIDADCSTADLWYERFAELLGCEPRPGAIAAAIEDKKLELERLLKSIPEHRRQAADNVIRSIRRTAVNCGASSTCAVAGWAQTSDERKSP